jgi:hypothetical protein
MTPTHTWRRGRLYRCYVSINVIKQGTDACPVRRVSAGVSRDNQGENGATIWGSWPLLVNR